MEAEGAARTTLEAEKKKEGDFDTTFRQVDFVLYAGLVLWWLHDRADMTCGIRFSWTRLFVCYLLSAFSVLCILKKILEALGELPLRARLHTSSGGFRSTLPRAPVLLRI